MDISGCELSVRSLALSFFCSALFLSGTATLANPADDFRNLLVEETDYLTLEEVKFDEDDMFLQAFYNYEPLDVEVILYLQYGDRNRIREKVSGFRDTYDITHSTDQSEVSDQLDRDELREISYRFRELRNQAGMIEWQIEHSTLAEDYEAIELFPTHPNGFEIQNFNHEDPKELRVNYNIEGTDETLRLELNHGEAARQNYVEDRCGFDEMDETEFGGIPFYTSSGQRSVTARNYNENVYLTFSHRFDGSAQEDNINRMWQKLSDLTDQLDLERIQSYEYPVVKEPGDGLEMIELDADEFAEFFPEYDGDLQLQQVVSYDDAMHLRADYLYEPADHQISKHMAFGDFSKRITSTSQGIDRNIGNFFEAAVEYGCLQDEIGDDFFQFREDLESPDDEKVMMWELENVDMSGMNPLTDLFPMDFGDYSITSFDPDSEDLQVSAGYEDTGGQNQVGISLRYGDDAAQQYNRYQLMSTQEERYEFESEGMRFNAVEARNNFMSFTYQDHMLIEVGLRDPDDLEDTDAQISKVSAVLEEFDTDALLAWNPPDDYEMEFDGTFDDGAVHCLDPECIDDHLAECEEAGFGGNLGRGMAIKYRIEEADGDQCRMSMTYLSNRANDELEDEPMYFYIDRDGSFAEQGLDLVEECIEGESEDCYGPMFEVMGDE